MAHGIILLMLALLLNGHWLIALFTALFLFVFQDDF